MQRGGCQPNHGCLDRRLPQRAAAYDEQVVSPEPRSWIPARSVSAHDCLRAGPRSDLWPAQHRATGCPSNLCRLRGQPTGETLRARSNRRGRRWAAAELRVTARAPRFSDASPSVERGWQRDAWRTQRRRRQRRLSQGAPGRLPTASASNPPLRMGADCRGGCVPCRVLPGSRRVFAGKTTRARDVACTVEARGRRWDLSPGTYRWRVANRLRRGRRPPWFARIRGPLRREECSDERRSSAQSFRRGSLGRVNRNRMVERRGPSRSGLTPPFGGLGTSERRPTTRGLCSPPPEHESRSLPSRSPPSPWFLWRAPPVASRAGSMTSFPRRRPRTSTSGLPPPTPSSWPGIHPATT